MLFHLVSVASNHVIGKDGRLPWDFPEIFEAFQALVAGNTILMGRKTYETLGMRFSGAEQFVLSQKHPAGGTYPRFLNTLGDALGDIKTEHAFIVGGEDLFAQTLAIVDGIYQVSIGQAYDGDAFYPPIPETFQVKSRRILRRHPRIELILYQNIPAKGCSCCGG